MWRKLNKQFLAILLVFVLATSVLNGAVLVEAATVQEGQNNGLEEKQQEGIVSSAETPVQGAKAETNSSGESEGQTEEDEAQAPGETEEQPGENPGKDSENASEQPDEDAGEASVDAKGQTEEEADQMPGEAESKPDEDGGENSQEETTESEDNEEDEEEIGLLSITAPIGRQFRLMAAAVNGEQTVSDWDEFSAALKNNSVHTIILGGDIATAQPEGDTPMVIPRNLTIKGNGNRLIVHEAGIILGGNTTFENISLELTSATRNAIIVNGHTLTINGVKNQDDAVSGAEAPQIHIFGGTVTDYIAADRVQVPTGGSHSQIIIKGKDNRLGDILAGSLSDANTAAESNSNNFDQDVTITIESETTGTIGDIYASGARESRMEGTGNKLYPDPALYQVSGKVTINRKSSLVKHIYGSTGGSTNAALVYYGSNNLNDNMLLKDLSSLSVVSGNLKPAAGSSLSGSAAVTVASGAKLHLENYGDIIIGDFTGGGTLILDELQSLTMTGKVENETKVAIGDVSYSGGSSKVPATLYPYIIAQNSKDNSFSLLRYDLQPDDKLVRRSDGSWSVDERGALNVRLASFSLIDTSQIINLKVDEFSNSYTVNLAFTSDSLKEFSFIPLTYKIEFAGKTYTARTIADRNGYHTAEMKDLGLIFEALGADNNGGIWVSRIDENTQLLAGTYTITVTVPTTSGNVSETFTLEIQAAGEATVGGTTYNTLQDALASNEVQNSSSADTTIRLLDSVSVNTSLNVSAGTFTLDLAGRDLVSTAGDALTITGGNVTISDSRGGGSIQGKNNGITLQGGTLSLKGGSIEGGNAGVDAQSGTLTLEGTTITGENGPGVKVSGSTTQVNLAGGKITGGNGNPSFDLQYTDQNNGPVLQVTNTLTSVNSPYTVRKTIGGTTAIGGIFAKTNTDFTGYAECFYSGAAGWRVVKEGTNLTLLTDISQATVNLTSATYDGSAKSPVIEVTLGGKTLTKGTDYQVSYTRNGQTVSEMKGAGTYQIRIEGMGSYAGEKVVNFIINKAQAPNITFPTATGIVYGQRLSDSILSGGSTQYGSFYWKDGTVIPERGTASWIVVFTPNADTLKNYEPITTTEKSVSVTVAKGSSTVTLDAQLSEKNGIREAKLTAKVIGLAGGKIPTGTVKFVELTGNTEKELASGVTLDAAGTATYTWTGVEAKIYRLKAVYEGDTNYQQSSSQEAAFDTRKQNQSGFALSDPGTKTYGDAGFTLATTGGNGTGAVTFESSDSSILSINGSLATIHKAGSVTITATKAGDSSYNPITAVRQLTIENKSITLAAKSFTITKGDAMPVLEMLPVELAYGDSFITQPTLFCNIVDTNTIGKYAITISGGTLTNRGSYNLTYVPGTLEIKEQSPVTPGGTTGNSGQGGTGQNTGGTADAGQNTATATTPQPTAQPIQNPTAPVQNGAENGQNEAGTNIVRAGQRTVAAGQGIVEAEATENTEGQPFLKNTAGATGWEAIRKEIETSEEENTVTVNMNGASLVPSEVLGELKDRNLSLILEMGEGVSWSINGQDFTGQAGSIDFGVIVGSAAKPLNNIPSELLDRVDGEYDRVELSLAHNGEFGFSAVLSVNVKKENAGYYANLYYYNEETNRLEFIYAGEIDQDGTVQLLFTHASEYILTVDTKPAKENTVISAETEEIPVVSPVQAAAFQEGGSFPIIWMIGGIGAVILVAGTGIAFVINRKKEKGNS